MINKRLTISRENDNFFLVYKGRTILAHSLENPAVIIGVSEKSFLPHKRNIASYKLNYSVPYIKKAYKISSFIEEKGTYYIEFDNEWSLKVYENDGRLIIEPSIIKGDYNYLKIVLRKDKDEAFYGCGEQFSYLNFAGKKVPMWTQEPGIIKKNGPLQKICQKLLGVGGYWWTNYYPQSSFVSSGNYYVISESYAYQEFDFSLESSIELNVFEVLSKFVIGVCNSAAETLGSLSGYLGRQKKLPDWVFNGAILGVGGGFDKSNPDNILDKIDRVKKAGTALAAVWTEDWTGLKSFMGQTRLYWNWQANDTMYPDLKGFIERLNGEGIKFLGYNNCFLMYGTPLYEEAAGNGYLVKDKTGKPYDLAMYSFSATMLDLTNPACREWIKDIIKKNMLGIGLSGWMADFGEYLPVDAKLYSNEDGYLMHNRYPVEWARVNAEAIEESGKQDIMFFSRSGNIGSTKYSAAIWTGDQTTTFSLDSGFPAAINASVSLGFSGAANVHSDISGYFGILWYKRTRELFMRWTEYSAFTPIMRSHEVKNGAGWTQDTDDITLNHFARFSRIRQALSPYFKALAIDYEVNGLPYMRHPYIHYEDDKALHSGGRLLQYQYLLGRDLMVAPVCFKHADKRRLYLPKDKWIDVWSGKEYEGGYISVDAPIGRIPLFYRKDSGYASLFSALKDIK